MNIEVTIMTTGLAALLRREIESRGWSYRQAAERIGIPVTTLNNLVHGRNEPTRPTLRKLAKGLGLSVERLTQAMGEGGEGAALPRPLRSLDAERLAYIDNMDEEEFIEFLDLWRKLKGGG